MIQCTLSSPSSSSLLSLLLLAWAGSVSAASDNSTLVETVFHYHPSIPVAGVAGGVYSLVALLLFIVLIRSRTWWGLCLPIGTIAEAAGFITRIFLIKHPNTMGLLIVSQILIVCSPAAFLAFNYVLVGRLLKVRIGGHHSPIRSDRLSTIFVISDVSTFMIQAAGSSLMSKSSSTSVGQKIWLVGLILQACSYFVFCIVLGYIHWSIRKDHKISGREDWWKLLYILYLSSIFIIIRCVYRIIEAAQGNAVAGTGVLMTHEIYFYLLDTLPLFIAISIYIPFWPGRYIPNIKPVYQMYSRPY